MRKDVVLYEIMAKRKNAAKTICEVTKISISMQDRHGNDVLPMFLTP